MPEPSALFSVTLPRLVKALQLPQMPLKPSYTFTKTLQIPLPEPNNLLDIRWEDALEGDRCRGYHKDDDHRERSITQSEGGGASKNVEYTTHAMPVTKTFVMQLTGSMLKILINSTHDLMHERHFSRIALPEG